MFSKSTLSQTCLFSGPNLAAFEALALSTAIGMSLKLIYLVLIILKLVKVIVN